MKELFSFLLICILISCNNSKPNKDPYKEKKTLISIQNNKTLNLLNKRIDVQNIKSQLDGVTTTFLSKEDRLIFPDRKINKFYAHYTLIKNDKGGSPTNRVGTMIVYDSINPYIYEKNTDEFVEITLNDIGISLYDGKLEIGMKISDLIKELGKNFDRNKNTYIYRSKNKIAFFKIRDSLITKIKIGVYVKGVAENKILKKVKW